MSKPIIQTRELSMATVRALMKALKDRAALELKDIKKWEQEEQEGTAILAQEALGQMRAEQRMARRQYLRLKDEYGEINRQGLVV